MSDGGHTHHESLSLDILERIDSKCLEFEAAWRDLAPPCLNDFVSDFQGSERRRLLRELILLDLDYRQRGTARLDQECYRAWFPHDQDTVAEAFRRAAVNLPPQASHAGSTPRTPQETHVHHRAVSSSPARTEIPAAVGRDYEILREIGRGGMGIVYKARQRSVDRMVALKICRPEYLDHLSPERQTDVLTRFRTESLAAARLEHDHLVTVFDVGEIDGRPFYAMQLVEGQSLAEILRDGPIEYQRAASLLVPVARAVDAAHRVGILHRDLKPHNVLVDNRDDRPLVTDFGLAKLQEGGADVTLTGEVCGSPPYMAPEQISDAGQVTVASDVYGLGATLYHMITGRPPFQAPTVAQTLRQVVDTPPVPPRQLIPVIARDLETICLKCLQKEHQRRYRSAEALAEDLERFLSDRPIHARSVTKIERMWRWIHRNPHLAGLLGTLIVTLALGLASVTFLWRQAGRNLEIAQARLHLAQSAVNDMLLEVGSKSLRDLPEIEPVRKTLLEKALHYYEQILRDLPDDPQPRRDTGKALVCLGDIHHLLGMDKLAEQDYLRAIDWHTELHEENPAETQDYRHLATAYSQLGALYFRQGRLDDSIEAIRAAHKIEIDLSRGGLANQFNLANSFNNLGVLHQEAGRGADAATAYQSARGILQALIDRNGDNVEHQKVLAAVLHNLTRARQDTRGVSETVKGYQKVLQLYERLTEGNSSDTDLRYQMGKAYSNLGWFVSDVGQSASALQPLEKAHSIFEHLTSIHSTVPRYRFELARALAGLAYAHQFSGETDKARIGHERVIEILEPLHASHSDMMEYQGHLGNAYVAMGWHYQLQDKQHDAETAYERALALLKPVVAAEARMIYYQRSLAQAYHELGMLHGERSPEQAAKNYRQAIQVRADIVGHVASPMNLGNLAWSYSNLAAVCDRLGESDEGIDLSRKAVQTSQQMADTWPEVPAYRDVLANRLAALAMRYGRIGNREEALDSLKHAVSLSESLVETSPDTERYVTELASRRAQLGEWLGQAGNAQAAVDEFGKAIEEVNAVVASAADHPDAAVLRSRICHALLGRARVLSEQLQQHQIALTDVERALEMSSDEDQWRCRLTLSEVRLRSGDVAMALAETDAVLQAEEPTAKILAECARIYALAVGSPTADSTLTTEPLEARRESYAVRAIQLLERAISTDRRQTLVYIQGSEFDAVRERADLRAIIDPATAVDDIP